MNVLHSTLRQRESTADKTPNGAQAETEIEAWTAPNATRPIAAKMSVTPIVDWPAALIESSAPKPVAAAIQRPLPEVAPTLPTLRPAPPVSPIGVVTAAPIPDAETFVCISTLDTTPSGVAGIDVDDRSWRSGAIDLTPSTVDDLWRAAREAKRRAVTAAPGPPVASSGSTSVTGSAVENEAPHAAKSEPPPRRERRPIKESPLVAARMEARLASTTTRVPLVPRRPIVSVGRDPIHKAMEKYLAFEQEQAAQRRSRVSDESKLNAMNMQEESEPAPLETFPRATASGRVDDAASSGTKDSMPRDLAGESFGDRAKIVDRAWAASLSDNSVSPGPIAEAAKPASRVVTLPPQDIDRRGRYWKVARRLLTPRGGYRLEYGVVAMFVAAGRVGEYEFSMVEMARAALEAVPGRVLIVAVDGGTEFLTGSPVKLSPGFVDVWSGASSWTDAILRTSDARIDLVPWGTSAAGRLSHFNCDELRANYSLILLAAGDNAAGAVEMVASSVDDVLLVVALGNTRTEVALGMSSHLAALHAPLTGCVVVGVEE